MLAHIKSLSLFGLKGSVVDIEVDTHRGLPKFAIVGLGDAAIQESKERIRSAIKNAGYQFPRGVISVNLAPADLRKHGPRFDLPIALGILCASGQIKLSEDVETMMFFGELAFSGHVKPIAGILPTTSEAKFQGIKSLFVPKENSREASLVPNLNIFGVHHLNDVIDHLQKTTTLTPNPTTKFIQAVHQKSLEWDMAHIRGNEHAKRALEIAAAGAHNILFCGPPGSGKTMLAQSLSTILPDLTIDEALDITKVHSVAGLTSDKTSIINRRPFRTIHHTASNIAIVGGGNPPRPGEISLAHRGILFLDEFPEFPTKTLEVLRQPLEDGKITISRSSGSCTYPAQFMLVGAMNPTPCGYDIDDEKCTSKPFEIQRYQNKISGPLLDRIDLHVSVPRVEFDKLKSLDPGEPSSVVQKRVQAARDWQTKRFIDQSIQTNAEMSSRAIKVHCQIDSSSDQLIKAAMEQYDLSGRAYFRILKVARTIADLEQSEAIQVGHIAEALGYRKQNIMNE